MGDSPVAAPPVAAPAASGERDYYSIAQAAALLGVSRVTVWRWIRDGRLPMSRLGRRTTRIKRRDLERLIDAGGNAGDRTPDGQGDGHEHGDAAATAPRADWRDVAASGHFVQFYEADAALVDAVADFIGASLRAGDAGIVLATAAHRAGIEERLAAYGLDLAAARAEGRYVARDAADLLARVMVDGAPDPAHCAETLGGIVARAAGGGRRVRAFGELVALLALDGNHEAAVRLEALWNDLRRSHDFALFCAYPLACLDGSAQAGALGAVCAAHAGVIPAESYAALPTPDDRLRAIAALQQQAASLAGEVAQRKEAEALLTGQKRVLEMIATGAALADVLAALIRMIEAHDDGLLCSVLVRDPEREQFCLGVAPSLPDSYSSALANAPISPPYLGPCGKATHLGEEVVTADVAGDGRWADEWRQLALSHDLRTCYSAPIVASDGTVLGSFAMYYREPRDPRPANARLVEMVTNLAGIAIERGRAEEARARQARQAELRAAVGAALTRAGDLRALLQRCAEALVRHLDAAFARVWTLNEAAQVLELQASAGLYTHLDGGHSRVPVGQYKIGLIAQERTPHLTNQVIGDPRVHDQAWARREGMVAFAGYPLVVEDRLVGVLGLFARQALADDTLADLAAVAQMIANGIERKRADEALREESATLETINRIGRLLAAELDQEALVQAVTDAVTALSGAQFGAFFYNVVDERGEAYQLYTLSGARREDFAHFPLPRNTAIFGPTFRGEGVVRLDDVTQDPRYGRNAPYHGPPPGHLPVRSYLAVPVITRSGEVIGGLFLGHPRPSVFTARAERLVVGLAAQAAVAMDNARLYQEAQRSIRARDEFLATVSHDLKSPLSTIKGYAQLLRLRASREGAGELPPRVADGAAKIEATADKMTALIGELLDVARLEAGESLDLEREPTDLVALAAEAVAAHRQAGADRRLDLLAPDAALTGTWDRARLERALNNLLGNAVKYSPDGGPITVSVRQERDDAGAWAVLAVRDEGVGIPAAELPHVFERFWRASNVAGQIAGTGIGLASARYIVEGHGGALTVASREGRGSTFTVRLPLTSDE